MSPSEARVVADRAANAFPRWSSLGPNARRALLMNAAAALEARKDDFVRAMMAEVGATAGWAMFNAGSICALLLAWEVRRKEN